MAGEDAEGEGEAGAMTVADPAPHAAEPLGVVPRQPLGVESSGSGASRSMPSVSVASGSLSAVQVPQPGLRAPLPRAVESITGRPAEAGSQSTDPHVGTVLAGRYRIERLIAKGGMGRVYLATQLPLDRRVAVKLLAPRTDAGSDPHFVRRFFLEAAICARLSHPNIVTVHDYGEAEDGLLFMAMEYLDGAPLSAVIKTSGPISADRTLAIAIQIARGLREAHGRGIVHRDLKPGNIILLRGRDEEGGELVKVLDFGLVKVYEADPASPENAIGDLGESFDLTRAGILLGSPRYMSPEQIRNEHLDPRTDIYSFGVILYQMSAGRPPFNGKTSVDILHQHMYQPPPPIEGCPPALHAVIMRCLAKSRDDRYASVNDLLRELKNVYRALLGHTIEEPRRTSTGAVLPDGSGSFSMPARAVNDVDPSNRSSDSMKIAAAGLQDPTANISNSQKLAAMAASATAGGARAAAALSEPLSTSGPHAPPPTTTDLLHGAASTVEDLSGSLVRREAVALGSKKGGLLVLAVGIAFLGVCAAALLVGRGPAETKPPERTPVEVATPAPVKPKAQPTLLIESRPAGALVLEGGRVLGRAPLALPLDADEKAPRDFEVKLDGYATFAYRQAPTEKDVRVIAQLVELPPETPPVEARPGQGADDAKTKRPVKRPVKHEAPAETTAPSDIRLSR